MGDDSGANEAFLETIEEEEAGHIHQEGELEAAKRRRRTSPAPKMIRRSPKTSASPKPPKSTSGNKRNAHGDSKEPQTNGANSEDPTPMKPLTFTDLLMRAAKAKMKLVKPKAKEHL